MVQRAPGGWQQWRAADGPRCGSAC
jgi:hypothetical protein